MNEKKKMFEVNVNVMVPENVEPCTAGGMSLEKALELVFDEIRPMVFAAVSGFVQLAEEVFDPGERNEILNSLERLEGMDDGRPAMELLYAMFLASKLKVSAEAVHEVMQIAGYFPELCEMFMEEFFESDDIDEYLVTSWLMADGEEESAGGVLS